MLTPLRLYPLVISGVAAATLATYYLLRGKRKSPEQREQERRLRIATEGRITDGTVIDVCELSAGSAESHSNYAVQLLIFNYDVAGVTYEASQDITQLRHFLDLHKCRLGLPASIKYDPQNPGNSIVVAEGWSGLRK